MRLMSSPIPLHLIISWFPLYQSIRFLFDFHSSFLNDDDDDDGNQTTPPPTSHSNTNHNETKNKKNDDMGRRGERLVVYWMVYGVIYWVFGTLNCLPFLLSFTSIIFPFLPTLKLLILLYLHLSNFSNLDGGKGGKSEKDRDVVVKMVHSINTKLTPSFLRKPTQQPKPSHPQQQKHQKPESPQKSVFSPLISYFSTPSPKRRGSKAKEKQKKVRRRSSPKDSSDSKKEKGRRRKVEEDQEDGEEDGYEILDKEEEELIEDKEEEEEGGWEELRELARDESSQSTILANLISLLPYIGSYPLIINFFIIFILGVNLPPYVTHMILLDGHLLLFLISYCFISSLL